MMHEAIESEYSKMLPESAEMKIKTMVLIARSRQLLWKVSEDARAESRV